MKILMKSLTCEPHRTSMDNIQKQCSEIRTLYKDTLQRDTFKVEIGLLTAASLSG